MFHKKDRSSFKYWFAHWCAYQMTALNLGIWKFKYMFHDIEKPWMKLWYTYIDAPANTDPYKRVQKRHRHSNKHHLHYWISRNFSKASLYKLDIDAMIVDWECSRFTKAEAQKNAAQTLDMLIDKLRKGEYNIIQGYGKIKPQPEDIDYLQEQISYRLQQLNLA